jgi:hypothetical protein
VRHTHHQRGFCPISQIERAFENRQFPIDRGVGRLFRLAVRDILLQQVRTEGSDPDVAECRPKMQALSGVGCEIFEDVVEQLCDQHPFGFQAGKPAGDEFALPALQEAFGFGVVRGLRRFAIDAVAAVLKPLRGQRDQAAVGQLLLALVD